MSVIERVVTLMLFPILTRVLSIEEFGLLDMFVLFIGLLSVISSLELHSAVARYYKSDESIAYNANIFSSLLVTSFCFGIFIFVLASLFSSHISVILSKSNEYSFLVILCGAISLLDNISNLGLILLRRQRKIVYFSLINIISTVVYVIIALILIINLNYKVEGLVWAILFARFLKLLLTLIFVKNFIRPFLSFKVIKKILKYSLPMVPAVAATWADRQSNRIILLYLIGLSGVGLFGTGARIAGLTVIGTMIFQQAWGPFALEIIDSENRNDIYVRIFKYYYGLFSILGVFLVYFSPELLFLFAPKEYFMGYVVIPWLVGAYIIHNGGGITNIGTLVTEKTAMNSVAAWIGLMMNIILCYFLVSFWGIAGAAIGMMISKLVAMLILLYRSEKLLEIQFDKKFGSQVILIYISFSIVFLISNSFINFYTEYFYSFLIRLIVCTSAIYLLFKLTFDDYLKRGVNKLLSRIKWNGIK